MDAHRAVIERVAGTAHVAVLVGGLDSGKTTFGLQLAEAGLARGRRVAFLDADLGQKAVGPPGSVTLKLLSAAEDLERLATPDMLHFVGSTSPQGQLLPLVVGAGRLLARAEDEGADLIVVDTTGLVSGVYGQILMYHSVELLQPDLVVGLQRGEELDPILGIVRRFFGADVVVLPVSPEVRETSIEERARKREAAFARYFQGPLQRWRVKPTVFMPSLPALFEQVQLDRLLVGLSDGKGETIGLGYLEYAHDEGVLRLRSPSPDAPKALKLGSIRLEEGFRIRRVDLRNLFGSD